MLHNRRYFHSELGNLCDDVWVLKVHIHSKVGHSPPYGTSLSNLCVLNVCLKCSTINQGSLYASIIQCLSSTFNINGTFLVHKWLFIGVL